MPSPVPEKIALFQFLSCKLTMTSGQLCFSRLLNPDWSIQISGAPAVYKVWFMITKHEQRKNDFLGVDFNKRFYILLYQNQATLVPRVKWKIHSISILPLPTLAQYWQNTFDLTEVCILLFSNIERGNADTYSVSIAVMTSCFWHFLTQHLSMVVA